jgi:hypothetical protein
VILVEKKIFFFNVIFFFLVSLVLFLALIRPGKVLAKNYRPEISGSFESGDKLYTDPGDLDEDDPLDYYRYDKQWLKYKQKLAVGEYYYLKIQRQQRIYENSIGYNNLNLETEGNYTFYLTERLRNRFKLLLRDKDYIESGYENKDYRLARLQYTLQFDYNQVHSYQLILQKQWTNYQHNHAHDYQRNRIALKWDWELSADFEVDTKLQYDWQRNDSSSKISNKDGRKIAVSFKYKI